MFINLKSPVMLELLREVERFAPSAASVLITGESGVGVRRRKLGESRE